MGADQLLGEKIVGIKLTEKGIELETQHSSGLKSELKVSINECCLTVVRCNSLGDSIIHSVSLKPAK